MKKCYYYINKLNGFDLGGPSAAWCGNLCYKGSSCYCTSNGHYFIPQVGFKTCPSIRYIDGLQFNISL